LDLVYLTLSFPKLFFLTTIIVPWVAAQIKTPVLHSIKAIRGKGSVDVEERRIG